MCMEDIRLGRKLRFERSRIDLLVNPQITLPADSRRTRIALSNGSDGAVELRSSFIGDAGDFLFYPQGIVPYVLTIEEWSSLICGAILVNCLGTTGIVYVVETLLEET